MNESTIVVRWRSTLKNVSGYNVVILNESGELTRLATGNTTSFVKIGSLEQCRNYTVKVAANSSLGIGNYSSMQYLTRCGKSITTFYNSSYFVPISFEWFKILIYYIRFFIFFFPKGNIFRVY